MTFRHVQLAASPPHERPVSHRMVGSKRYLVRATQIDAAIYRTMSGISVTRT